MGILGGERRGWLSKGWILYGSEPNACFPSRISINAHLIYEGIRKMPRLQPDTLGFHTWLSLSLLPFVICTS